MEPKNPFNEARKARRIALNLRNSSSTLNNEANKTSKRNLDKDQLIDLSKKDNKSGRGRYI